MKQQSGTFVNNATLNAIKNLLFSNNGTDLSAIVNDLNTENDDLTAINVALVYKGANVEINKNTRYKYNYNNKFYVYNYISHSLIRDCVKVALNTMRYEEDGTTTDIREEFSYLTIGEWEALPDNFDDIKGEFTH